MSYILKSSNIMPKFGIGTWRMGENENKSSVEINAVYYALKNGVRLIDTAEMYGEGGLPEIRLSDRDGSGEYPEYNADRGR